MAFHTWPGFDRRVGESRMADLAETLNRLVSRSARPDWTLAAVASLIRLVSRPRSDTRSDKLKYFVLPRRRVSKSHGIQGYPI
jgi:hypothetical protein